MDAWIIVAVVLVAAGLLVSLFVWWRNPGSGNSEYVTVAELQARLDHEYEDSGTAANAEATETAEPEATSTPPATGAPDIADAPETDLEPTNDESTSDEPAGSAHEPGPTDSEQTADDGPDDADTAGKARKSIPPAEPGHDH